jgi:hypothetical protein
MKKHIQTHGINAEPIGMPDGLNSGLLPVLIDLKLVIFLESYESIS